jgi:radical SAM protein with 4Fe4S-binding SPASM domain
MVDYSKRERHLESAQRRRELLAIEQGLHEHSFPPQIAIENTSICNLACIHCSHSELMRPQRHMQRALWDKIVEEVGSERPECEIWPTVYGEALILGYKGELWERIDYAHEVGCRNLVLNSNGVLLQRWENTDRILSSPLRRVIFSLDGLTKETFEHIRAKAKWHQVYPAVEALLAERARRRQSYPVVIAQLTVMRENAHEVDAYREYWRERGAEVKIRPMLEWTATGSVRTSTIAHDSSFRIACPWANNTMAIHQDGRVVTCSADYEGRFTVGNIADMSIKEAWARLGEVLRRKHREHRWGELPEVCKGCGDWQAAGAQYDAETVEGTRPFWYYAKQAEGEKSDGQLSRHSREAAEPT